MAIKNRVIAAAILLSSSAVTFGASAVTVPLTTDFYFFGDSYRDNDRIIVNNGAGTGFEALGFLGFDLSSFVGQDVVSATLSMQMYCQPGLSCTGDDPNSTMDIAASGVGVDPASVTDDSGLAALEASIGAAADTIVANQPGIYTWDLTDLVASWLADPASVFGIALTARGDSSPGFFNNYFYSSTGPAGTLAPTLDVTFVPVPAAVWLMGSALFGLVSVGRRRR
ncbi:MAG: DNRLRE domain-containing protein [Pseudomonadota bacterium]